MEMRGRRRFRTKAERRQIVEETMQPGASVSRVARAHDVNANQVFHWRRQYRQGWFDETGKKSTGLVRVRIAGAVTRKAASVVSARATAPAAGVIDIDLGHARVRIEGSADPGCVRAALEGLVR
jgi:transposase